MRWIRICVMGSNRLNPGEDVIDEIIIQGMVTADCEEPVVFIWNGNAIDQLNARIRDTIHSCTHPVESVSHISLTKCWCRQCGAIRNILSTKWRRPDVV